MIQGIRRDKPMCLLGELIVKGSTDFTPFGTLFEPKIYVPYFIEKRRSQLWSIRLKSLHLQF